MHCEEDCVRECFRAVPLPLLGRGHQVAPQRAEAKEGRQVEDSVVAGIPLAVNHFIEAL